MVTLMPVGVSGPPATSIAEVIARMQSIDAALPAADGVACFNRMYLEVTQQVDAKIRQGVYADTAFVTTLDVVFANLYFAAVDGMSAEPPAVPRAWNPLIAHRSDRGIEAIQFALGGMNAHINHDLPLAVVATCLELATTPQAGEHHADYQRIDTLLDAAEQAIRQSFETSAERVVDRHVAAVATVLANWSICGARDAAWDTACALWEIRDHATATALLTETLATTVAMVSQGLLSPV